MNSIKKMLMVLALSSTIVSCREVKIENGQLPDQYLTEAKKYMGTYSGVFNGINGSLALSLEGNFVRAVYSGDIIDTRCESQIGNLLTVTVSGSENNPRLDEVNFAFNPNKCVGHIIGRNLYMGFKNSNGRIFLEARIVKRRDWETTCGGGGSPNPTGCSEHPVNVYIRGAFVKSN